MDPLTLAFLGGSSLISGLFGSSASKKAGEQQAQAATQAAELNAQSNRENIAFQQALYDDISNKFDPWRTAGTDAHAALMFDLGLGPQPMVGQTRSPLAIETFEETIPGRKVPVGSPYIEVTEGRGDEQNTFRRPNPNYRMASEDTVTTKYRVGDAVFDDIKAATAHAEQFATLEGGELYGGYQKSPGYDARLGEGQRAIAASIAPRQGIVSGNALKQANKYGQDFAANDFGNHVGRLFSVSGMGSGAAGNQAMAGQTFGGQVSSSLGSIGSGNAQGAYGSGNALAAGRVGSANAITDGFQNVLGTYAYMKGLE